MAEEVEELFERLRRRVMKEVDRVLSEFEALRLDWTPDGRLSPLYTIYEFPDKYVVLVDLAAADVDSVEVKVVDGRLVIEARLEREISLSDLYGTAAMRGVTLRYYRQEIPLPPDADVEGMTYRVRPDKIVEIVIPRRQG